MLLRAAYRLAALAAFFPGAFVLPHLSGQELHREAAVAPVIGAEWKSTDAQHAYGLPDTKPNKKGTLTLDANALTFTSKASNTSISRSTITAFNAGNDRVELWGTGGRILRMVMPNGSGLAAAAMMHHRIDMLTVEFRDTRGGIHSAVFYLPAKEADVALSTFAKDAPPVQQVQAESCGTNPVDPHSVLVDVPEWDRVEVPAAYRALVYEHILDRLRTTKDVGHIYRFGEVQQGSACPQYTIKIAIEGYKKGNQVVRAATGPIGMFTSATQMTFSVTYSDELTGWEKTEEIKATVRTESESTSVADAVAKKLAKQYGTILKTAGQPAVTTASTKASS